MPETSFTLLINPLATPLQFALYDNHGARRESWEREGYASEILVPELEALLERRVDLKRILYVHGPGSYMGIKLCYITLRTLELTRGIPFEACSAFSLNDGRPVKAMGSLYFVKEKETIITRKFEEKIPQEFTPPLRLERLELAGDRRPDYRIPAV